MDGAAGALAEVKRIVAQLRAKWPKVRIVLRGDSGFCREELMAWCEAEDDNQVDFLFGLARNSRLQKIIGKQMREATQRAAAARAKTFTAPLGAVAGCTPNGWPRWPPPSIASFSS